MPVGYRRRIVVLGLARSGPERRRDPTKTAHTSRARRRADEVSDRWKERKPCEYRRTGSPLSLNATNHAERQARRAELNAPTPRPKHEQRAQETGLIPIAPAHTRPPNQSSSGRTGSRTAASAPEGTPGARGRPRGPRAARDRRPRRAASSPAGSTG